MCLRSHSCWTPKLHTDFNFGTPSSGLYWMTMDKLHKLSGPQFLHLSDGDSNASCPAQSFMLRYKARIDTKWRVTMPMTNTQWNPHVWLPWGWLYPESGAWPGPKGRFLGVRMGFGRLFWREQGWLQLTLMRSQIRQTSSLGLFLMKGARTK